MTVTVTTEQADLDLSTVNTDDMSMEELMKLESGKEASNTENVESVEGSEATAEPAPEVTEAVVEADPVEPTPPGILIPKPRFDQVLARLDQLEKRNAYLEGRTDQAALAAPGAKTEQVDPIVAIDEQIADVLGKADAGEITITEMYRQTKALEAQKTATQAYMATPAQAAAAVQDTDVVRETASLREQNPWIDKVSEPLMKKAGVEAEERLKARYNVDRIAPTPRNTILLRREIVEVAKEWQLQALGGPTAPTATAAKVADAKGVLDKGKGFPPNPTTVSANAKSIQPGVTLTDIGSRGMSDIDLGDSLSIAELERLANSQE